MWSADKRLAIFIASSVSGSLCLAEFRLSSTLWKGEVKWKLLFLIAWSFSNNCIYISGLNISLASFLMICLLRTLWYSEEGVESQSTYLLYSFIESVGVSIHRLYLSWFILIMESTLHLHSHSVPLGLYLPEKLSAWRTVAPYFLFGMSSNMVPCSSVSNNRCLISDVEYYYVQQTYV